MRGSPLAYNRLIPIRLFFALVLRLAGELGQEALCSSTDQDQ